MTQTIHYSAHLFGEFHLDGADARMPEANSRRLQALLAYLILHREAPQSRRQLAFLFWPDSSEAQARNALRQLLFHFHKAWPQAERFVRTDAQTLQWRPDSAVDLDVAQFEVALATAQDAARTGDASAEEDALTRAAQWYRGDLLPGCYDDWTVPERDRLREQCIAALARLSHLSELRRDYAAALRHAQQAQRLDPCREPTYVTLMRLHALNQDRPSAVRVYRACIELFARELGVVPGAALREAYARLMAPAAPAQHQRSRDGMAPLVGRHDEWRRLALAWQRAQLGDTRFALISGEAGIGKSRLAEELVDYLAGQGIAAAATRAYAAEGRLAFAPVIGWLRAAGVRDAMNGLGQPWLAEIARLLPELLTEHPGLPPPSPLTEYGQRQRFFEALARAVPANGQALLLWLDDLQWCDGETLEWLRFLMRFDAHAKRLVVATVRREEITPEHPARRLLDALRRDDQLVEIPLHALDAAETARIAGQIINRPLTDGEAMRLFEDSEGNPLFAVEMMRARADPPAGERAPNGTSVTLPPKVYAIISNRLAQLSPAARDVAALAAIIGRAFTADLLVRASDLSEDALASALDELWQRRIVRETGSAGTAFDFSHDRIRDVACAQVSPLQRCRLHRRVAQALEQAPGGDLDAVSAQLAAHYEQAGLAAPSAAFYRRAAGVAQRVYAYDQAIALLGRGLAQAGQITDPQERARRLLELQLDLAPPIRIARGWASPELESPLRHAVELGRQAGDPNQQACARISLAFFHIVRAEFTPARRLSEEVLAARGTLGSDTYEVMARTNLMGSLIQQGEWATVEAEYQRAHRAYDASQHAEHVSLMGANFGVLTAAWSAHALWLTGFADQALQRGHEALAMANRLAHPFSQALALAYLATQHALRREPGLTLRHARQAHDIAGPHHVGYYLAWADVLLAWANAKQSPGAEAAARMQAAIERFQATGARLRLTLYFSLLAECLGDAGETGAALAALEQAFDHAQRFGAHWLDAELHRLRGELLLHHGGSGVQARSSLTKALAIANAQGARPLALRAALLLANLGPARDRAKGRAAVESALAGLTEGFDQPDVVEGRALLARG